MKYLLFLFISFSACFTSKILAAENDLDNYNVKIVVDGISNDNAVLAYYYMDKKYIRDTIEFDANGTGYITGNEELPTGVYLLAFPSMNLRYFELILGEEEEFTMMTDTSEFIDNMKIKGSLENDIFYENMRFLIAQGKISRKLQEQAAGLDKESEDYKSILGKLKEMDRAMKARRSKLHEDHPDAYYTKIVMAMSEIELPENPNPADSSYPYHYYQEHYFDHIDFSDARLTRTPFLMRKILTFLDDYTIPLPDSINAAAEKIERSKVDYEMFQFCLVGIFNKYAKSKIMAHELVYVNLAKKYYLSGEADWITEENYNTFKERLEKMEPTLLGKKAPQIIISDMEGRIHNLHEENQDGYTILTFWNSSCGHCKKEMPKLVETFKNEIAPLGKVKVLAISTEVETDEWTKFIAEHNLVNDGWIHAHDPNGRNPFRYSYNIESTPLIFVLDPDKEILAKRISVEDIRNLIEFDIPQPCKAHIG